jgi:hypothetical protein
MTRLLEFEDEWGATESHTEKVDQEEEGGYGEDMAVEKRREKKKEKKRGENTSP